MNKQPVGVLDSGVGGLTVVKTMLAELPNEDFIYFGDTAHLPYGNKTPEQLMTYARSIMAFFGRFPVKAVVVACGTHSSVTLQHIINDYPVPMLGVVKGAARSAVAATSNGRIGVVATQATVNSGTFTREIKALCSDCTVVEMACPKFVPLVEAGKLDDSDTRGAVKEYIGPLMDQGIDTLVLGCTHYPFLAPVIAEFTGSQVTLVDPSHATVDELKQVLLNRALAREVNENPQRQFYVSGNQESFFTVGKLLIGDVIQKVEQVCLD
ncbi:MAG TPA: glutamate racemase [Syntrophomonadaceae bacterium]|nr:glutamate racemase [Syntrophomonadaceae bacterium]HOQ09481.1 glutamate racemase [Syntrophomonadaceae bacterium]HPU48445.1 glutamate racemase [Syntrophomonadaceae bacterium]